MSEELIKLEGPEDAGSVSWGGSEYKAEGGVVQVPAAALADLAAHGFSVPKPRKGKSAEASA